MALSDFIELGKYIGTFIAGIGTGWTLKVYIATNSKNKFNTFTQRNNTVNGDQAGRDIKKK